MASKAGPVLLLGAAALGAGYLVLSGKIPGYGTGTPKTGDATKAAQDAGGAAINAGSDLSSWWFGHAWAYTATVAGVLAVLGIMTWNRIGGWGRAVVLVLAAATVAILVTR